ncbi:hypothetical protein OJF2_08040 [Aquisphaera giovannonii]|uniref:Uncharacterized protein n=1 Tax=Aquisphaera giovannonii TaxID=406548 RepID=A0A5B9VW90_9BACT|nr:hypothetical protein [Aquisphaera giovannonii]QEH32334.1 hypothetical protein OJF2_08040 [Aquisphaera giovannonii]
MAWFVERRSSPAAAAFSVIGSSLLVPILAAVLFIREWISAAGFVLLTASGVFASVFLNGWVERRNQTVREVRPGKKAGHPMERGHVEVFPEAIGLPLLVTMSVAVGGILLADLLAMASGAGRGKAVTAPLVLLPAAIVLVAVWGSQVRLIIEGDEVRTLHPWLRLTRDRRFRFAEIDAVEASDVGRGNRQVAIKLQDGSTVRYSADPKTIDRLVAALTDGVARAKPRPADLDELL